MGAWDCDPFGNDAACDWKYDLGAVANLSLITDAIDRIHKSGPAQVRASDAEAAIAAADTLARLNGNFYVRNAYTASVDKWVASHPITPPPDALDSAIRAITRILTPPSELLDLWGSTDKFAQWKKHLSDLQERLR